MSLRATEYIPKAIRAALPSVDYVARSNFGHGVIVHGEGGQRQLRRGSKAHTDENEASVLWRVAGNNRTETIDHDSLNLSGNVVVEIDCRSPDKAPRNREEGSGAQNMAERILERFQRDDAVVEHVAQYDDVVLTGQGVRGDFVAHTLVVALRGSGLPDPGV